MFTWQKVCSCTYINNSQNYVPYIQFFLHKQVFSKWVLVRKQDSGWAAPLPTKHTRRWLASEDGKTELGEEFSCSLSRQAFFVLSFAEATRWQRQCVVAKQWGLGGETCGKGRRHWLYAETTQTSNPQESINPRPDDIISSERDIMTFFNCYS